MPPIELPMMRRTCFTPRPSVSSRYCPSTMSSALYLGNFVLRPSDGFADLPWADSRAKRNGLGKADLHVLAKLLEQRLERGQKAEALPRREVVREHELLQLGIPERVEVEVPRQVAA